MKKTIYCADAIARYGSITGPYVVIERLNDPKGLALVGGKQDQHEMLSTTIFRELFEETGLTFEITEVFGTRAEKGRDSRGAYVSTVFVGVATGVIKEESGKTRVLLLSQDEVRARLPEFVFDHGTILAEYMEV